MAKKKRVRRTDANTQVLYPDANGKLRNRGSIEAEKEQEKEERLKKKTQTMKNIPFQIIKK